MRPTPLQRSIRISFERWAFDAPGKRCRASLLSGAVLCSLLLPQSLHARVGISEVMWAGSDVSTADEWVELIADQETDIGGWRLTTLNSKGEEDEIVTFEAGTRIGTGVYFLISNYAASASRLSVDPDVVTTKVSLPNTKLLLRLRDTAGNIMDEVDDGSGAPFAGNNTPKASMERRGMDLLGTLKGSWQTAITTIGFDEGPEIYGTPGFPNSAQEAPQEPSVVSAEQILQSQQSCSPYTGTGLVVSEIFPAPAGKDEEEEWIEIRNTLPKRVDLCGWKLDDAEKGSRPFPLDEFELSPGQILVFHRIQTKIALNDDGDSARLIDPLGRVSFEKGYEKAKKDFSFAMRDNGVWLWTEFRTPGAANQFRTGDRSIIPGTVVIDSVLPNPEGTDDDREWVQLRNATDEPMLLNGWKLRMRSGNTMTIHHLRLRARETIRLMGDRLPLSLPNAGGSISLLTPDMYIVSLLAWDAAADGQVFSSDKRQRVPAIVRSVQGARLIVSLRGEYGEPLPEKIAVSLDGVDVSKDADNLIRALLEGKNIELEFESDSWSQESFREAAVYLSNGDALQSFLLRHGLATVDTGNDSKRQEEYLAYEREARDARLGKWGDEGFMRSVLDERVNDQRVAKYQREGVTITTDPGPGLLRAGSGISLKSNLPASIFASVNGSEFQLLTGSVVMAKGVTQIIVFAQAAIDDRMVQTEPVAFMFVEKKNRYDEDIRITEVFPAPGKNPSGEWIEIRSFSSKPAYLAGWKLDDQRIGGSKPWTLPSHVVLQPGEFAVFPSSQTKLALNDTGDDVRLIAPDNSTVSMLSYGKVKKGQAIAWQKDLKDLKDLEEIAFSFPSFTSFRHCVTDVPTPGAENFCYTFLPEKTAPDSDRDFIPDDREIYVYRTNPFNPDTDGDRWIDGFEVGQGTDPLSATKESRALLAAYHEFIEERMNPKWRLFKKKGLTLTAKSYPLLDARVAVAGEAWSLAGNGEKFERVITRPLSRGEHTFPLHLRDLAGREVFLASAYRVALSEPYAYAPRTTTSRVRDKGDRPSPRRRRPRSPRGPSAAQPEVTEDQDIFNRISVQRSLISSLLEKKGDESAESEDKENMPLILLIILFWILAGCGLWVWGRRK